MSWGPKEASAWANDHADSILEAVEQDNNTGYCIACGAEAEMCEPDVARRRCQSCDERAVYGAEQLLLLSDAAL